MSDLEKSWVTPFWMTRTFASSYQFAGMVSDTVSGPSVPSIHRLPPDTYAGQSRASRAVRPRRAPWIGFACRIVFGLRWNSLANSEVRVADMAWSPVLGQAGIRPATSGHAV